MAQLHEEKLFKTKLSIFAQTNTAYHFRFHRIAASMLREASYSTIRLGAYEPFKELLGAHNPANTPIWKKIVAAASSGAIGSAVATPTDLVKIRLQAEGILKPGKG